MISLLSDAPIFHGPHLDALQNEHGLPPDIAALHQQMLKALSRNYEKTKDLIFRHAMRLANGGEMPSDDEIRRNATQVISKDGTVRLLWGHPPIKPGDEVDLSYEIATIERPKP